MVAQKQIFKRIESNPAFYETAFKTREQFDFFCLSEGLSPLDVAELLYDETGYDWRK